MTYRPVANLRKLKLHALTHPCPEAGGRSKTKQPRVRLERWGILRDLLVDSWSNPDHNQEDLLQRHLGALSPLESDLLRRMYLNVTRIFPIPSDATVDLEGRSVPYDDHEAGVTTSVYLALSVTHGDGTVEHARLKTGRSSSTPEEAAVLWADAEEGETFVDLMAWPGEVEPIEPPSDIEQRLQELIETSPALHRSGVRPGPRCVWCPRTAVCGAYPADRVVPSNARTLNLTKTDVETLSQCHRRVAWRRVHGIPRDDGDDVDAPESISQGRLFHAMISASEGQDDPEAAAADFLHGVPPSELADLQLMWDNHRALLEAEGLAVRTTEFPVGFTLLEGERAETQGVTVIGYVDLTARDATGGPVAVEIKTGNPGDTDVEDDLYAVGMRRWIDQDTVVIHRHHVRPTPAECEVITMSPLDTEAAKQRLGERVSAVHGWDWEDPLQPRFTVGPWCGGCEYRITCEAYR